MKKYYSLMFAFCACLLLFGCSSKGSESIGGFQVTTNESAERDNKSNVLETISDGKETIGNEHVYIDVGQAKEGYLTITYLGESAKSKLQITGPEGTTYTHNLNINEVNVIPLSGGSGNYDLTLYEGVGANQYSVLYSGKESFIIENEFGPYLYPNMYVNFNKDTAAVKLAEELSIGSTCDLETVSNIYQYIITNIEYDYDEAENVEYNYLPNVDEVLTTKKGICFDYASLMAAMLRSQSIPTKLQIGYAQDAYHAWISVYTKDQGWIDGLVQFDGTEWTLMDPTFAASNAGDKKKLKKFIGTGENYVTKYSY